jgi:hypothetical protein
MGDDGLMGGGPVFSHRFTFTFCPFSSSSYPPSRVYGPVVSHCSVYVHQYTFNSSSSCPVSDWLRAERRHFGHNAALAFNVLPISGAKR